MSLARICVCALLCVCLALLATTTAAPLHVAQHTSLGVDTPADVDVSNALACFVGSTTGNLFGEHLGGGTDAFLECTLAANASHALMAVQLGTPGVDTLAAVVVDGVSSVVFAVGTTTSANFSQLPLGAPQGDNDAVLLAYATDSWTPILSAAFGTTNGSDTVESAAGERASEMDAVHAILVAGSTTGVVSGSTSAGGSDMLVVRLNATTGVQLWSAQFGSAEHDSATAIVFSAAHGLVLVAGTTETATTFHGISSPLPGKAIPVLLALHVSSGSLAYAVAASVTGTSLVFAISVHGPVAVVAGATEGTINNATALTSSTTSGFAWAANISASGVHIQSRLVVPDGTLHSVIHSRDGSRLYVAGTTNSTLTTAVGGWDAFAMELSSNSMSILCSEQMGTPLADSAVAAAIVPAAAAAPSGSNNNTDQLLLFVSTAGSFSANAENVEGAADLAMVTVFGDPCAASPCANGGVCVAAPSSSSCAFTCSCPANFTGALCEDDVNECLTNPDPCSGLPCANIIGGYLCGCVGTTRPDEMTTIYGNGGPNVDDAQGIAVDQRRGRVFMAGYTATAGVFNAPGNRHGSLTRFQPGNFHPPVWTVTFGALTYSAATMRLAVDESTGIVYVPATATEGVNGEARVGGYDGVVVAFDGDSGMTLWSRMLGSTGHDALKNVVSDGAGRSVFAVGITSGNLPGYSNPNGDDAIIFALNSFNGSTLWQYQAESSESYFYAAAVHQESNRLFVVGSARYSIGNVTHPSPNVQHALLMALDATTGELVYAFIADQGWLSDVSLDRARGLLYSTGFASTTVFQGVTTGSKGIIWAVNATSAATEWVYAMPGSSQSVLYASYDSLGDTLYFAVSDSDILGLTSMGNKDVNVGVFNVSSRSLSHGFLVGTRSIDLAGQIAVFPALKTFYVPFSSFESNSLGIYDQDLAMYAAEFCSAPAACASSPCLNGQPCVNTVSGFQCSCTGYSGALCETNIDECANINPCFNNSACTDTPGSYSCACDPSRTGKNCETDIASLPSSCSELLARNSSTPSGTYAFLVQGALVELSCDMDTLGGGWTLLASSNGKDAFRLAGDSAYAGDPTQYERYIVSKSLRAHFSNSSATQSGYLETAVLFIAGRAAGTTHKPYIHVNRPPFSESFADPSVETEEYPVRIARSSGEVDGYMGWSRTRNSHGGDFGISLVPFDHHRNIYYLLNNNCINQCFFSIGSFYSSLPEGIPNCRDTKTIFQLAVREPCLFNDGCACTHTNCFNGGSCVQSMSNYTEGGTCACLPAYTGAQCETEVDECASMPCTNNATCVDGVGHFVCNCSTGYTGVHCETNIDECASSPCGIGGTCTEQGLDFFTCTCSAGYTGVHCETNIDECVSSPCSNGATCVDGVDEYTCVCAGGYMGSLCETDIDECSSVPCRHGATCSNLPGRFECACVAGYTGVACETDIDECASAPCAWPRVRCLDLRDKYECVCPEGVTGVNCTQDLDECQSSPCLRGSTCTNLFNAFNCTCLPGTAGVQCQSDCLSSDAAQLTGCENVGGGVTVSSQSGLQDLTVLGELEVIRGSITIRDTSSLKSAVGFSALLADVPGNLEIRNNAALSTLSGLNGLRNVTGNVVISGNPVLETLAGLGGLESVGGSIAITDCDNLRNLTGLGSVSAAASGPLTVTLRGNKELSSLAGFEGVDLAGGTLVIENLSALTSLEGITEANRVGRVVVKDNSALIDLSALRHLSLTGTHHIEITNNTAVESLEYVNGNSGSNGRRRAVTPCVLSDSLVGSADLVIVISNNPSLASIECDVSGITEARSIRITGNTALRTIEGFSGVTSIHDVLEVSGSPVLVDLGGFGALTTGDILVQGNGGANATTPLALTLFSALPATYIGNISLIGNPSLKYVPLSSLVTLYGTLLVRTNGNLDDLGDGSTAVLDTIYGSLVLEGNTVLSALTGLTALTLVTGNIVVATNTDLCTSNFIDFSTVSLSAPALDDETLACSLSELRTTPTTDATSAARNTDLLVTVASGSKWLSAGNTSLAATVILTSLADVITFSSSVSTTENSNVTQGVFDTLSGLTQSSSVQTLRADAKSNGLVSLADSYGAYLEKFLPCDSARNQASASLNMQLQRTANATLLTGTYASSASTKTATQATFLAPVGVSDLLVPSSCHNGRFFVYASNPYSDGKDNGLLNSALVTFSLGTGQTISNLDNTTSFIMVIPHNEGAVSSENRSCVFWNVSEAQWSTAGCELVAMTAISTTCRCNHLTSFAVLGGLDAATSAADALALTVLTYIGCIASMVAISFLWLSLALLPMLRKRPMLLLLSLSIALFVVNLVFLAGIDRTSSAVGCRAVTVLLYYFLLVSFFMSACIGHNLRFSLVTVFGTPTPLRYYLLVSWLLPVFMTAVAVGIDYGIGQKVGFAGSATSCWLSERWGLIGAFLLPVALILCVNLFFFISVTLELRRSRLNRAKNGVAAATSGTTGELIMHLGMVMSLGLAWLFAYLGLSGVVAFWYLFVLFNAFQGLMLTLIFVVRGRAGKEWRKLLSNKFPSLFAAPYDSTASRPTRSTTTVSSKKAHSKLIVIGDTSSDSAMTSLAPESQAEYLQAGGMSGNDMSIRSADQARQVFIEDDSLLEGITKSKRDNNARFEFTTADVTPSMMDDLEQNPALYGMASVGDPESEDASRSGAIDNDDNDDDDDDDDRGHDTLSGDGQGKGAHMSTVDMGPDLRNPGLNV